MRAKKSPKPYALGCLLLALGLNACFLFAPDAPQPVVTRPIDTVVAETIAAQRTLSSGSTAVAQLTQWAVSTPAASPPTTLPLTATPTLQTATALPPTETPVTPSPFPPSATPIPPIITPIQPLPPPIPCDWAQYVKDVTVPDGTVFSPGAEFVKVWRIRNIGSCAWNPSYTFFFVRGDRMQAYNYLPIPGIVYPGESVDLAVDLVAPGEPGHYRGYWMLSNPYGQAFGIGGNAQTPFWVDIQVVSTDAHAYDFISHMCAASWRNSTHSLPCPGVEFDPEGSVILLESPLLETGKHENEPALWTRPEATHDGWIIGTYPSYKVKPGDRFMADIGCLQHSKGCDVIFYLDYRIKGKGVENLGSWHEVYDGKLTRVIVDLSELAGQSVQFILSVNNKGKPSAANAFWLVPSIQNKTRSSIDDPAMMYLHFLWR